MPDAGSGIAALNMLAVRRVSQDNQGKRTAGVDGVKLLTPKQRIELVGNLKLTGKAKPTRRVWIPKPGRTEKRPLGIPTMHDRALQALAKLVLEPEWEAKFEPNSYGFRPGRSCHDAIGAIFDAIRYKPKYVLDADIAKCFDRINHSRLLEKLNTFPKLSRQIRAWLKSGVLDKKEWFPTDEGTPQGGVISPLLANIALHGMEERTKEYVETLPIKGISRINRRRSVSLIRYADDFVILHESPEVLEGCTQVITDWLTDMGLELKPSKTRTAHTLKQIGDEKPGFDFLGFNVKQYIVGKNHSGKNTHKKTLGFKTIIKPSKEKESAPTADTHSVKKISWRKTTSSRKPTAEKMKLRTSNFSTDIVTTEKRLQTVAGSVHDRHGLVEEPYEAKVSRTVLKTSRRGDSPA